MTEATTNPPGQSQNIQSGPEIVTDFVQKIAADQSLDKDTVNAMVGLQKAGKLTTTYLLKILEKARGAATHGSPAKT